MSLDGRRIGLIEDDRIMGESLVQRLTLEGANVRWWRSGSEATAEIVARPPELVVCDIRLPDMSGEDVFRGLAGGRNAPPFLFITAYADIDQAVRLMRAGAGDYLTKPFELDAFLQRLRSLARDRAPSSEGSTLGVSAAMQDVESMLRRIAPTGSTVLLQGETGAGKDVAARFIHSRSKAAEKPFIAVNCAAIPPELLESELFGHERGAFSGADKRHLGYAERAGGGTLFLDEIGDLSLSLQSKILRLLEARTFQRIGGESEIPFSARVVAATNQDLTKAIDAGIFRNDLFYRLAVVTVDLPPLRERPDDIPWLMDQFFANAIKTSTSMLKGISSLTEEAALAHPWPGNIRELRNRMERGVALALGDWLMPSDLFPPKPGQSPISSQSAGGSLADVRDNAERRRIILALKQSGGRVGEAAKALDVSRTTLWERMRRLGLSETPDEQG
jgi:DNA-binding NtrC family response regulator